MSLPRLTIDEQTRLDELLDSILETASTVDDVLQYLERSTSLHLRGEVARGRRSGKTRHPDDGVHGEDGGVKKDLPLDLQHSLVEFLGQVALRLGEMPALSAALAHVARRMATRSVESRPSTTLPIPPAAAAPVDVDKSLPLTPPVDIDKTLPCTPPAEPSTPPAAAIFDPPSSTPSEREVFLTKILICQAIEDDAPLRDALSLCAVFRFMRSRALSTPRLWANVTGLSPAGAHHLTYILSLSRSLFICADLTLTTADRATAMLSSLQTHIQRVQHLSLKSDVDGRLLDSPIRALLRVPSPALESLSLDLPGLSGAVTGSLASSGRLTKLACKADQLGHDELSSVTTFYARAPASWAWMALEEHTLPRIAQCLPNVRRLTTDSWFPRPKVSRRWFQEDLLCLEVRDFSSLGATAAPVGQNFSELRADNIPSIILHGRDQTYIKSVVPKCKGDVEGLAWYLHEGNINVHLRTRDNHRQVIDANPVDACWLLGSLDNFWSLSSLTISNRMEAFHMNTLFKTNLSSLEVLELLFHGAFDEGSASVLAYAGRKWPLPPSLVTLRLTAASSMVSREHSSPFEPTMKASNNSIQVVLPRSVDGFLVRHEVSADKLTLELARVRFEHDAAAKALEEKVKALIIS
ncbi:hypothetical protein EXIGLDRAFT_837266 [Exidia glandulosa HHB12029]|uniref:Uncharacterized protein n=1 Tax=Exidia glandulosa HHB12029 TaxID=1314781 RepID=A0A165GZH0_EXIGL|nr:hypothetical protein EXIGLDRAFT_837266 [Exidia glandulosa HHB12029]